MPLPGLDFLEQAARLGDTESKVPKKGEKKGKKVDTEVTIGQTLQRLYDQALRTPGFRLPVTVRGGVQDAIFVPGHIWNQHVAALTRAQFDANVDVPAVDGPRRADVMVIGKALGKEELQSLRNLTGPTGRELVEAISRAHIKGAGSWYVTSLVKFMPPDGGSKITPGWIADCLPLLHMELRIVRPKYIICLGAEAAKALLGKGARLKDLEGRIVDFEFPAHRFGEEEEIHKCQVTTVIHPVLAGRDESMKRALDRGINRCGLMLQGIRFDKIEPDVDHRVIDTLEDAQKWAWKVRCWLMKKPQKSRFLAWDAEWQGTQPGNRGSYLRTLQCSWMPKHAVVFRLRRAGGEVSFVDKSGKPAEHKLFQLLDDLNKFTQARWVGHFFNADLEWLIESGFDPTRHCKVPLHDAPDGRKAWQRFRDGDGGFDTGLTAHAIEETARLGLENLANQYTTVPRYDLPLDEWKREYCSARKLKQEGLEGYGEAPEEILVGVEMTDEMLIERKWKKPEYGKRLENSYAAYDADATLRVLYQLLPLLDCDYQGNCCWEPAWEAMITMPWILEMKQNGILVDRNRITDLTAVFLEARNNQTDKLREWARWPTFNPRSVYHARELLFGEAYNGLAWVDGKPQRQRPEDGRCVGVAPLLDTSKPPKRWEDIAAEGLERQFSPSTAKGVLGILAVENLALSDPIGLLRDHRFLDQVVKQVLRPPKSEDSGFVMDDDGNLVYDGGLARAIDDDGRVRTNLSPTTDTGRLRSFRPNLQNISKTRDKDYKRLLGKAYAHKLRSIFVASPGHCLIEFDYKGAELAKMAFLSGDPTMIDHVTRSNLDEDDPRYYDIHSSIAVLAFRLKCSPTKSALEAAELLHFRTLAKNVIFGLAYGRGAKAIALQARENRRPEDPEITVDDAQRVIDAVFALYPLLGPFLDAAGARAVNEGWLCHDGGRFRRFPTPRDRAMAGEFERQGKNFPIQGGVASQVNRGLANLMYLRDRVLQRPDLFRMLLQIHDAGLIEAPYAHVEFVVKQVIPAAMIDAVPIFPTDMAGVPTGTGPYYLGLDTVVMPRWGEGYTAEECRQIGISTEFATAA